MFNVNVRDLEILNKDSASVGGKKGLNTDIFKRTNYLLNIGHKGTF